MYICFSLTTCRCVCIYCCIGESVVSMAGYCTSEQMYFHEPNGSENDVHQYPVILLPTLTNFTDLRVVQNIDKDMCTWLSMLYVIWLYAIAWCIGIATVIFQQPIIFAIQHRRYGVVFTMYTILYAFIVMTNFRNCHAQCL